jgi:hypothetical protein
MAADRPEELRRTAAECLALAQATTDPDARTALILMAERLYDAASRATVDFDSLVQDFNDDQMTPSSGPQPASGSQPVMQQQQQVQPRNEDDKD